MYNYSIYSIYPTCEKINHLLHGMQPEFCSQNATGQAADDGRRCQRPCHQEVRSSTHQAAGKTLETPLKCGELMSEASKHTRTWFNQEFMRIHLSI